MVVVRLAGGIGNQLFQYSFGRAVAVHRNDELFFDSDLYTMDRKRSCRLDLFGIRPRFSGEGIIQSFAQKRRFLRLGTKHLCRIVRIRRPHVPPLIEERFFHYDSAVFSLPPGDLYFDGYWQSEKYFHAIRNELRQEFALEKPHDANTLSFLEEIERGNAVSVHIRRGDYISEEHTGQHHGVATVDYYAEAVRHMNDTLDAPRFFVFSDDVSAAKKMFEGLSHSVFIEGESEDAEYRDLFLMQRCNHHIIANSTFSWWGAWLNPDPSKTVVAPAKWFRTPEKSTKDLFPSAWVVL